MFPGMYLSLFMVMDNALCWEKYGIYKMKKFVTLYLSCFFKYDE